MLYRVMIGAGLLVLGYYVGREVGRTESVRRQLDEARERKQPQAGAVEHESSAVIPKTSPTTSDPNVSLNT